VGKEAQMHKGFSFEISVMGSQGRNEAMGFGRLAISELCLVICDHDFSAVDLEEMD
jgi:hypothetical protein